MLSILHQIEKMGKTVYFGLLNLQGDGPKMIAKNARHLVPGTWSHTAFTSNLLWVGSRFFTMVFRRLICFSLLLSLRQYLTQLIPFIKLIWSTKRRSVVQMQIDLIHRPNPHHGTHIIVYLHGQVNLNN